MTLQELIRSLQGYARAYGEDRYVVLADQDTIFGDCKSVGIDDETGDIVITTQD